MATGETATALNPVPEDRQLDGLSAEVRDISLDVNGGTGDETTTSGDRTRRIERQESVSDRPFKVLVAIDSCQWSTYAFDCKPINTYLYIGCIYVGVARENFRGGLH